MNLPEMKNLEMLGRIGGGGSGEVFAATGKEGSRFAVKFFEGMAINRAVLAKMTARLEVGGWPEGVVPLESADFDGRPACLVMPFLGETEGEGDDARHSARSLQYALDEHPGENSWNLVKGIAYALSEMHERRVPHANLKPGTGAQVHDSPPFPCLLTTIPEV